MRPDTIVSPGIRIVHNSDPDEGPMFETAEEIKAHKPKWLLPGRLIANGLSILEGDQGAGKSTLISGLVAAVTTGKKWWSRPKSKPMNVLWFAGEEDPGSMIKPRLIAAKADMKRVRFPSTKEGVKTKRIMLPGGAHMLRESITKFELGLIIIDPLICYCDPHCDLNTELGARAVVDPLNQIAIETGCAVMMSRHLRKDRTGPRSQHGLGSVAIGATARTILVLDYPDLRTERRVCRVVKPGPGPRAPATEFHFSRVDDVPIMTGIRELDSKEDQETGDLADAGERDVRQDARLLLRRVLAEGWVMTTAVYGEASAAGISERTIRTAKAELGVQSRRVGTSSPAHWEFGPPKEGW